MNRSDPWYVSSQARALAELFLDKLESDFSVSYEDHWADYHLQFRRQGTKKSTSLYVELRAVREPSQSTKACVVKRPPLVNGVTPIVLLLVVDIVNEKLYHGKRPVGDLVAELGGVV